VVVEAERTGTIAVGTLLSLGIAKTIEEAEAIASKSNILFLPI
jgi:hypothetical protein